MAAKTRNLFYVVVIISLVVLPTALSLGWYEVTKNPNLRPLGVTRQSLDAYARAKGDTGDGVQIIARVAWVPPHTGGYSRKKLERTLVNAFAAKGVDVIVMFEDGDEATTVTYQVGKSYMGPYSTHRAGEGIRAAVDAYHMYVPSG